MDDSATAELMTPQQAADKLIVSAKGLRKLLEDGILEVVEVDGGERIRSVDVLAYKAQRDARRRVGLEQLTYLTEELGGYEKELRHPLEGET